MRKIKKLIIDTDIGDDLDDVLALVFALNSPEVDLIGVTTVYKNTKLRGQLALKILELYGKDEIPVAIGQGKPMVNEATITDIPTQFQVVDKEHAQNCDLDAVDFIIDRVKNNDEVTIVTIGALTNIAMAINKAPEIMKKARLVIMGGIISNPFPEGNISTDPEAAKIVFESGIPITMVGLDVTLKCGMNREQIRKIQGSSHERHQLLSRLLKIWNSKYLAPILRNWGMEIDEDFEAAPTLHDPLAVAVAIDPSFVKTKASKILVETKGEYTGGVTIDSINVFNGQANGYNADVCIEVDSDRFMNLFMERIMS